MSVVADVTDAGAVHDAVATIEERARPITVLVNNADSLRAIGPLWEVDPDDWWSDVRTSLGGTFNLCREVVPRMIERREGRIVTLASYVAVRPSPYQTGYACAKVGVVSVTEALAASLAEYRIKMFAVAPGFDRDGEDSAPHGVGSWAQMAAGRGPGTSRRHRALGAADR